MYCFLFRTIRTVLFLFFFFFGIFSPTVFNLTCWQGAGTRSVCGAAARLLCNFKASPEELFDNEQSGGEQWCTPVTFYVV